MEDTSVPAGAGSRAPTLRVWLGNQSEATAEGGQERKVRGVKGARSWRVAAGKADLCSCLASVFHRRSQDARGKAETGRLSLPWVWFHPTAGR